MSLRIEAQAKVNLSLEVLFFNDTATTEIYTVLQTITLQLRCSVAGLESRDNLALRAGEALRNETGVRRGASIDLEKRIPVAAGLGSGSTDAAAALVGLDHMWATGLPTSRLRELAADLGSDVPFFVDGGTAVAKGRGELVSHLPPAPKTYMVILNPGIEMERKTSWMYALLGDGHFSDGSRTARLAARLGERGDLDESLLYNVFEEVAFDFVSDLSRYRSLFLEAGAASTHLAGAGPALFALVPNEARGRAIQAALKEQGAEAYVVHTVESRVPPSKGDGQC
jgi:4-diphosphocytidyl-2-C-methyl-D-erythritol kinase